MAQGKIGRFGLLILVFVFCRYAVPDRFALRGTFLLLAELFGLSLPLDAVSFGTLLIVIGFERHAFSSAAAGLRRLDRAPAHAPCFAFDGEPKRT